MAIFNSYVGFYQRVSQVLDCPSILAHEVWMFFVFFFRLGDVVGTGSLFYFCIRCMIMCGMCLDLYFFLQSRVYRDQISIVKSYRTHVSGAGT